MATWLIAIVVVDGQQGMVRLSAPRLWTDEALQAWATPIAGVAARPNHYSEAEYYAAPQVDELRTYPVYRRDREPAGYRDSLRKLGPRPLIEPDAIKADRDWIAIGRRVFEEMDLGPDTRTDDPRILAWLDDPDAPGRDGAVVTKNGVISGMRWIVDRDGSLKVAVENCGGCHSRVMPDGTIIQGAQGNLNLAIPVFGLAFGHRDEVLKREGRALSLNQSQYAMYGAPWVSNDIHASLKTMAPEQVFALYAVITPGTFPRFNGSPWFANKIPDLIGVADRKYLDATGTHLNRGPEDIARYGILVTDKDDGSIGPHRFMSDEARRLTSRQSDTAMYALARFISALEPPVNPNRVGELTVQGNAVFVQAQCAGCHTPPLYTNNKLIPVDGFVPPNDPATAALDIMPAVRLGTDSGLALRTRKGTGYYKVPSLKGLWYRSPLEHSGSVMSLEEWFDASRLRSDYVPKGWNPPGVKTRAIPGHPFGLGLSSADKRALIAFLKTL